MGYSAGQTAVIVPIPAAEPVVSAWRSRFDTSAAFGVPAHVTVVYPFLTVHRLSSVDTGDLVDIFAAVAAFRLTLGAFKTFPGAGDQPDPLYLEPEPDSPFRRLTAMVSARWPQAPPYGGRYSDPIPHLTVTDTAGTDEIDAARRAIAPALPIVTHVDRGCLLVFDGAIWRERISLPFRPG